MGPLGDKFRRGHEDRACVMGLVSNFIRRDTKEHKLALPACPEPHPYLLCVGTRKRQPSASREESPYQKLAILAPLVLDF